MVTTSHNLWKHKNDSKNHIIIIIQYPIYKQHSLHPLSLTAPFSPPIQAPPLIHNAFCYVVTSFHWTHQTIPNIHVVLLPLDMNNPVWINNNINMISKLKKHRVYIQWCGNSQSYRTLSNKSSECLVNWNWTVYKVYGKQDKSDENRSKCQAVGSVIPCIHTCVYILHT